jgi:predicted enzyme related to lactoylglutathione lyase
MPTRLVSLVLDAADPPALARFWASVLGWSVTYEDTEESVVAPPDDDLAPQGQVPLLFGINDDGKSVKNRIHLDLASTSPGHQVELVARIEALGGRRLDIGQGQVTWVVMADPEDNELCVVSHAGSVGKGPASALTGIAPVAAIVFDCADPERIAPFWSAATGWPILGRDDEGVWLRDTSGGGPFLDLHRVTEPKTAKLRVHFDVAPYLDGNQAAEVDRLRDLGATDIDIGQGEVTWVVLADPEGNELCVLSPRD